MYRTKPLSALAALSLVPLAVAAWRETKTERWDRVTDEELGRPKG